jgi:hypothetical protein
LARGGRAREKKERKGKMDTLGKFTIFVTIASVAAFSIGMYSEKKRIDNETRTRANLMDVLDVLFQQMVKENEKMAKDNARLREELKAVKQQTPSVDTD